MQVAAKAHYLLNVEVLIRTPGSPLLALVLGMLFILPLVVI